MKTTITYIAICVGVFIAGVFVGQSNKPEPEVIQVETERITDAEPAPPIKVEPSNKTTQAEIPIVNIDEIRAQVVDSLLSMGYTLEVAQQVSEVIPEAPKVDIKLNDHEFEGDGWRVGANGYGVTLNYVEWDKVTSTITTPTPRSWRLYGSVGMANIGGLYYPNVGALVTTPKDLAFGLDVGMHGGSMMWMARVSYRISGK